MPKIPERAVISLILLIAGCRSLPSAPPPSATIWYVPAPSVDRERDSASIARNDYPGEGALVVLDSASFRPSVVRRGGSGAMVETRPGPTSGTQTLLEMDLERIGLVTSYQGHRYHPETVRALAADSVARALAARAIVLSASSIGGRFIMDLQGSTPQDLPGLIEVLRATGEAARRMSNRPLAVVVPPGDTMSYPTGVIARVADVLVLRLHPEHRQGTAPGPLTSPEMIAREIGMRARVIGANRLMAELPLYGYRWNADGTAAPITYAEAQALVMAEAGEFRRDQASQFLVASGRNGWAIWIPDARTTEFMIKEVLRSGVKEIALAGPIGSDLSIPDRVKAVVR